MRSTLEVVKNVAAYSQRSFDEVLSPPNMPKNMESPLSGLLPSLNRVRSLAKTWNSLRQPIIKSLSPRNVAEVDDAARHLERLLNNTRQMTNSASFPADRDRTIKAVADAVDELEARSAPVFALAVAGPGGILTRLEQVDSTISELANGQRSAEVACQQLKNDHNSLSATVGRLPRDVSTRIDQRLQHWNRKQDRVRTALEEIEATLRQCKDLEAELRSRVAEDTVAEYAQVFKETADVHKDGAFWWTVAAICLVGATGLYAANAADLAHELATASSQGPPAFALGLAVLSRLSVLTLAFFAISFCGRSARAHQHNRAVAQFKHDALRTYRVFTEKLRDDPQRAALLATVTQAIFESRPTGFSARDVEIKGPWEFASPLLEEAAKKAAR